MRSSRKQSRTDPQQKLRKDEARLTNSLESMEARLAKGKPPTKREEKGIWESLKGIASDVWNGTKSLLADLGLKPADLPNIIGGLAAIL